MAWPHLRVKENAAYVAPSVRICVFHSPYSTVSASSAHVMVFSSAMLAPMTNRPTIANWSVRPWRRRRSARRPGPSRTPIRNPRFLPRTVVIHGPNGPT